MTSTPVYITPPPLSSQSMADLLCTIMVLCYGSEADGSPFWAYVCVKPSMAKAFREAYDHGDSNFEDYGTIIETGKGDEPSDEIKQRMSKNYGVNHQYEAQLLDIMKKLEEQQAL